MVTAGIFMVARFSPLFELSDTALSFVIVIGAIGALFLGILGIIQNDIKRVVAYSTRSEEHTSELQSLMRSSYAVFCLKRNNTYRPCCSRFILQSHTVAL